ncbi:MAG: CHC2 zinc finger domain-containing protein [Candidatus Doudnabacteria bacterium]|nr:CHC2 zinc finger domain-containing protein [Candidatus Doudnabacteria bacterium]
MITHSIIEQIKQRASIVEVAEKLGLTLKKSGADYVTTARGEVTPALRIYTRTESWFHFAGDKTPKGRSGGDVIDLVELIKQCSTTEAIKWLAAEYHIELKPLTPEAEQKISQSRRCQEVLTAAANLYHQRLMGDDFMAKDVLEKLKQRAWSEELLIENLIGFAGPDESLMPALEKLGFTVEEVIKTGLIVDTKTGKHDFFQFRITFPLIKNGRVVYMTGRKTDHTLTHKWEEAKNRHLPVNEFIRNDYFYNEDALRDNKEVILCEGIPDCLSLLQWQLPAVALLGNQLKDGLAEKFSHCDTIGICLDTDGQSDPLKLAERIGSKAKIITLPAFTTKEGHAGKDINEFTVAGHSKEDFQQLLRDSKTTLEYQLPDDLQRYRIIEDFGGGLTITLDSHSLFVKRIMDTDDKGLQAAIEYSRQEKLLYCDNLTFDSSISRNRFARGCGVEVSDFAAILLDIRRIIEFRDALKFKRLSELKIAPTEPAFTDEQRQDAEKILQSPTLLADVCNLRPKLLVAGESENWLLTYLALTSRLLSSPISVIAKGASSGGKSYGVGQCLKLFPPGEYVDITDATARSFYHVESDAYKHKMIILFEKHGAEQTDYSIRSLQSEGKLKLQLTVKDPETGNFHVEIKEVEGPTGFITTTTSASIHAENETRNFSLYVDESEDQTVRTFEMTDSKYRGISEMGEDELNGWRLVQHPEILKIYERVQIPFVEEIRRVFPTEPVRVRRDYKRFLALVEASAFFHQYQRKITEIKGQPYLVAEITDYVIAKIIADKILRETIFDLPPRCKEIFQIAKTIVAENQKSTEPKKLTFTITEIVSRTKLNYDTVLKWMDPLTDKGYISLELAGAGRRSGEYALTGKEGAADSVILPEVAALWAKYGGADQSKPYNPVTGELLPLVKEPAVEVTITEEQLKQVQDTLGIAADDGKSAELEKELGF